MKGLLLILVGVGLCSFTPDEGGGALKEAHLKGKVKSIAYYNSYPEDTADIELWYAEMYDERGHKIATKYYIKNKLVDSIYYSYKAQGRVMEENSVSWKTKYTYDASGKLTETNRYKQEDSFLMEKVTFGYDANGQENEQQSFYNGVTLNFRMTVAITDTTREEISYEPSGDLQEKNEYLYDKNGDVVMSKQFSIRFYTKNEEDRQVNYVYNVYDKMGNWVKGIESIITKMRMLDRPERSTVYKVIATRKIEYYK